jgi:hypothetical protein
MKNLFLLALIISILGGCATPTSSPPQTQKTVVTLKQTPKLSQAEKNILKTNGFSNGVWALDCKNSSLTSVNLYDQGDAYFGDYYLNGKLVRKSEFYDVKQISQGVIQFKTKSINPENNIEFISSNRVGFINGKRMAFDYSVLILTGQLAGKESTEIKDGFFVKQNSDGTFEKTKQVQPFIKCK